MTLPPGVLDYFALEAGDCLTRVERWAGAALGGAAGASAEDARGTLARHNPQGRLVQPAEVADAVRWLCGEASGAIHGQAIAVAVARA